MATDMNAARKLLQRWMTRHFVGTTQHTGSDEELERDTDLFLTATGPLGVDGGPSHVSSSQGEEPCPHGTCPEDQHPAGHFGECHGPAGPVGAAEEFAQHVGGIVRDGAVYQGAAAHHLMAQETFQKRIEELERDLGKQKTATEVSQKSAESRGERIKELEAELAKMNEPVVDDPVWLRNEVRRQREVIRGLLKGKPSGIAG